MVILNWLSKNYEWIIILVIQMFIAYHVFFLSKKLSSRARLETKENIKQKAEELLSKIHTKQLNSEVHLVNINRYFKDYPSNKEKIFKGYSQIKAEIKSTRFDGVSFFCAMPVEVYRKPDGMLSFKGEKEEKVFNAYPVGIVPYEWIEYVDFYGDEYGYVPIFYCYFKGKRYWKKSLKRFLPFGYPYKNIVYYRENEDYHEGSGPADMKYRFIDEPIL